MKRLVIFPDEGIASECIQAADAQRDDLLPLLLEGTAEIADAPNYVNLRELVPDLELARAADRAGTWLGEFVRMAGAGERLDGIDWFEACFEDNLWRYFRNVAFGQALVNAATTAKYGQVVWCGGMEYPEWDLARGLTGTLGDGLGTKFVIGPSTPPHAGRQTRTMLERARARIARGFYRARREPRATLPAEVVAVFALSEGDRFTEPLTELHERYGERLQVWHMGARETGLASWAKEHRRALERLPYPAHREP